MPTSSTAWQIPHPMHSFKPVLDLPPNDCKAPILIHLNPVIYPVNRKIALITSHSDNPVSQPASIPHLPDTSARSTRVSHHGMSFAKSVCPKMHGSQLTATWNHDGIDPLQQLIHHRLGTHLLPPSKNQCPSIFKVCRLSLLLWPTH